jgi:hypothetical protein
MEIGFVKAKSVPHFCLAAKSLVCNRIQIRREIGTGCFEEKSIKMNECVRSKCLCGIKPERPDFTYKTRVGYKFMKRVGPKQIKRF